MKRLWAWEWPQLPEAAYRTLRAGVIPVPGFSVWIANLDDDPAKVACDSPEESTMMELAKRALPSTCYVELGSLGHLGYQVVFSEHGSHRIEALGEQEGVFVRITPRSRETLEWPPPRVVRTSNVGEFHFWSLDLSPDSPDAARSTR